MEDISKHQTISRETIPVSSKEQESSSIQYSKKMKQRRGKKADKFKNQNKHPNKTSSSKKKKWKIKAPVLRPVGAQVPRAPNNSTQFIMDDHENSSLYVHFNSDEMLKNIEYQGGGADGSSPFQATDWLPYYVADFKSAYQTAREDKLMNASIGEIQKSIQGLEAKISTVGQLLEASPSRILARLQEQLLKLQEENTSLKQRKLHIQHCISSSSSSSSSSTSGSSSSSDSSSDSSSTEESDSECSNPDCETCISQKSKVNHEEEKENTCPPVEVHTTLKSSPVAQSPVE